MISNIHGYITIRGNYYHTIIRYYDNGCEVTSWETTKIFAAQPRYLAETALQKRMQKFRKDAEREQQLEQWELDTSPLYQPVSSYFNHWLEIGRAISARSLYEYTNILHVAGACFDKMTPEFGQISPADVSCYIDALRKCGKAESTIYHHAKVLRMVFQDACNNGYLQANPVDGIELPVPIPCERQPYTAKEQAELLQRVRGNALELPVTLAQLYGLRCGEICGLCWEDVDFKQKLLHIRHNAVVLRDESGRTHVVCSNILKTPASRRSFPLHPNVAALLSEMKATISRPSGPIFKGRYGGPLRPDTLSKRFQKFLKEQKLRKIRFHDMRHGCASALMKQNCDLQEVQAYLGHSSIQSTLHYAHLTPDNNVKSFQTMAALFQNTG